MIRLKAMANIVKNLMGQSHLDVLADECATHKEFGQNVGERRTRYKDVMHSLRNVVIRRRMARLSIFFLAARRLPTYADA